MRTIVDQPLSALDAIFVRRSVRSYKSDPIDKSTIRGLLDAAVQAPTAMLEQPWTFVVVQDRKLLRKISDRAREMWLQDPAPHERHLRSAFHLRAEFVKRLTDPEFNVFYDAPALILICAQHTDAYVTADCWLAAENLMLAACALGLGTCVIGGALPALNASDTKAALGIPSELTAVVPIIVGVPDGAATPVSRRDPEIISWK